MNLRLPTGEVIEVRDFTRDPDYWTDPKFREIHFLGYHYAPPGHTDPNAAIDPPYLIEYIDAKGQQTFTIGLGKQPLGENRRKAEQYLMKKLGLSKGEMCQLEYTMTTDINTSRTYAGADLKFSFCPGAVALK